jgi:hypothetical protein
MDRGLRRIIAVASVSTIIPLVYFVGGQLEIDGLYAWPNWLFWVWPSSFMFIACHGCTFWEALPIFGISVLVNAGIWCMVLLPLMWVLWDVPTRLLRRKADV